MEEALRTLILEDAAVSSVATGVFWDTIPQGQAGPLAVLFLVSTVTDYHMEGPSGFVEQRVQIDCRGATKAAAIGVARAIEDVLSGYAGSVGSVVFQGIFKDNSRSSFERPGNGAADYFVESADYRVFSGPAA